MSPVSYRTEDGKTVYEGDLVYDYYSMEPVVIGESYHDGWFYTHRADGTGRSKAGMLDGSRICTLETAQRQRFAGADLMVFYIIESPTLGTLRDVEYEPDYKRGGKIVIKPKYSATASRMDSLQYRTVENAQTALQEIHSAHARGYKNAAILRSCDWAKRCVECGGWIRNLMGGHERGHRDGCPHIGGGD